MLSIAPTHLQFSGFSPSVAPLGSLSYALHKQLAAANNGPKTWGYSQSTGISLTQDSEAAVGGSGEDWLRDGTSRASAAGAVKEVGAEGPKWLKRTEGGSLEIISQHGTTAQMYAYFFFSQRTYEPDWRIANWK